MKPVHSDTMEYRDAQSFRNRAETCRSLARHVTDERALRVLNEMVRENITKAEELERLSEGPIALTSLESIERHA
jgi:hypothetical protein